MRWIASFIVFTYLVLPWVHAGIGAQDIQYRTYAFWFAVVVWGFVLAAWPHRKKV